MNRHSIKKLHKRHISTWKDTQYFQIVRKCKLKQQQDKTTYWPQWLKLKWSIMTIVAEDVEQLEPSYIAVGNAKQYSHFRKHFCSFLYN